MIPTRNAENALFSLNVLFSVKIKINNHDEDEKQAFRMRGTRAFQNFKLTN